MERGSVYPSWRYHATHSPVLCETPEQDDALGDEWSDTPASFAPPVTAEPDAAVVEPVNEAAPKKKKGKKI